MGTGIKFVDAGARLARISTTLDNLTASLLGTNVAPPGRTGTLTSQLTGALGNINGLVAGAPNRTGTLSSTLSGASASLVGTFTAPGNRPPVVPNPITLTGLQQGLPFSFDFDSVCSDPDSDPLTYILVDPLTLPAGLTQSGTRGNVISGTPTVNGAFSFLLDVDDGLVIIVPVWTSGPVL